MTSRNAATLRLRRHLRVLDQGIAEVTAHHREHMQCRAGCSDCCKQTFRVSELEGALLLEGFRMMAPQLRAALLSRAKAYQADVGMPCPVLTDSATCGLYDHRPRICRKYGIPLWHPDHPNELRTCEKNFRDVRDVPADRLVDMQAAWARDWLTLREQLAFGPQENHTIAGWLLVLHDDDEPKA